MKKLLLLIIFAFGLGNAQLLSNHNLYTVANTKSPSVSDLKFSGETTGVNQYTGDPIINFELFNYDFKYTNLGIDLSYNIKKVKPEAPPSLVGLGWDIIAGGAITRDVVGWYDEFIPSIGLPTDAKYSYYFSGYQDLDNDNWKTTSRIESIYNNPTLNDQYHQYQFGGSHSPDKFIINYGNLNAFFLKNHKGKWISGNKKNLVIKETIYNDPSNWYRIQENAPNGETPFYDINNFIYGFEITDDKGIKYYFGGSPETIEFNGSINNSLNNSSLINNNFYVKTWYIRKVVLPDSKEINFEYDNNKKATYICHSSSYDYSDSFQGAFGPQSSYNGGKSIKSYERNFFTYLKKISFNNTEIFFHKSFSNSLDYDIMSYMSVNNTENPWSPYITYNSGVRNYTYALAYAGKYTQNKHWYKLDSITLKNNNVNINTFRFNYRDQNSSRLRLQNIQIGNIKSTALNYSFNYNTPDLPRYNSEKTDYWGYYNNSYYDNHYPLDKDGNVSTTQSFNFEDYKEPNIFSKAETLKSLTYPTKGKLEFDYELHNYSKFYDYNKPANFEIIKNGYAGGMRVKSLIFKDEYDNVRLKKDYYYVKNYVLNNLESSGVVTYIPKYKYQIQGNGININSFSTTSYTETLNQDNSHVGYSSVTEVIDGNQFIQTDYTNHDNGYPNESAFQNLGYTSIVINNPNQFPFPKLNYKSDRRGKPLTIYKYDKNKSLVQKSIYAYQNKDISTDIVRGYAYKFQFYGAPVYHPLGLPATDYSTAFSMKQISAYQEDVNEKLVLSTLTEENYADNNVIRTIKNFSYLHNGDDYLTMEKTTHPDNKINRTTYNYTYEKGNQFMIDKNMVGIPLETIRDLTIGNSTKTLTKTETLYPLNQAEANTKTSGLVLPISVQSYNLQNPTSASMEVTYNKYDPKGNLQQYTTKDGLSTVIIWGYNQTQPIAKIEGAKLTDIQQSLIDSIVNASNTDAAAAANNDETSLLSVFNTFRNSLPNYQITTYTYDPLIGVRSITPPSEIKEVYLYDSANRLKEIRENSQTGNLLKEFKYNYKH